MSDPTLEYAPQSPRNARRKALFALLLITLFGAVLRFSFLSRPALWGDEAATYSRICGDYQDLIDILQFNGFVPLHYELYQWISAGFPMGAHIDHRTLAPIQPRRGGFFGLHSSAPPAAQPTTKPFLVGEHPLVPGGVTMTPVMMRIVPAIAGTLMIPAMYFLAIQIVNRRAALIGAMFTACSAYLLVYSRDAKMYMHFWLFCTLSVACLLWWLRVRTRISWLCWVASSLAMCGLHAPGAILLAIELIIFLSYDRRFWIPGTVLLIGFVLSGLLHGQTHFGAAHVDDRWLLCGFALALGVFAGYWFGAPWKRPMFFILGLAVILSGIGGYYLKFNRFTEQIQEDNWNASMLQWVDQYNHGRATPNLFLFPTTAYLTAWEWTQPTEEQFVDPRALSLLHASIYLIAAALAMGLLPSRSSWWHAGIPDADKPLGRRVLWIVGWIVIPAYAFYCVSTGAQARIAHGAWVPGFASPLGALGGLVAWVRWEKWLALGPACVVVIGILLCGTSWRERLTKTGSVLAAIVIVLALCGGVYLLLYDLNHRAYASNERWHSIWMPRYIAVVWPAFAVSVAALLSRIPTRPLRYGAIALVLAVNLVQFSERLRASEPPTELIARDMLPSTSNRTYLLGRFNESWGVKPGEGLYPSVAWRYYMVTLMHMKITPLEFRSGGLRVVMDARANAGFSAPRIAADVKRFPATNHITVWDKIEPEERDVNQDDPVKAQLGGLWRRQSEQIYSAFDHWTWQKLYQVRRREYVKVGR